MKLKWIALATVVGLTDYVPNSWPLLALLAGEHDGSTTTGQVTTDALTVLNSSGAANTIPRSKLSAAAGQKVYQSKRTARFERKSAVMQANVESYVQ